MFTDEQLERFRRMMELREVKDTTAVAAENAEKEYKAFQAELWDWMTKEGKLDMKDASVKIPLGEPWGTVTFQPRETTFGRVQDKDLAKDYFTKLGILDEVSEPELRKGRINEIVRDRREAGEKLPDGIDWYENRYVSITRKKK